MNFEINVEIFMRLARIAASVPKRVLDLPMEDVNSIQCVRLEYRNGNYFAISTNRKTAAVYYLGKTDQPNSVVHLTIDPALIKQCENEKQFAGKLHIISIPELKTVSLKSTFGYVYPGNAGLFFERTRLDEWFTWVPKTRIAASTGAMQWTLQDLVTLAAASPSGAVIFPEFIDAMAPVIMRDRDDPNWMGMFMANIVDDQSGKVQTVDPAEIPEWWIK